MGTKSSAISMPSAKKGGKEREGYTDESMRAMVRLVLGGLSCQKAVDTAGIPSALSSLKRYVKDVRDDASLQRDSPEATLAARLAFVDGLELKAQGNPNLVAARNFTEDELDYFAAALVLYSDMGWPLDYKQIRRMMEEAGRKWRSSADFSVGLTYVREFVNGRPELVAAKTANIDPLRTKKASPKVICDVPLRLAVIACHISWNVMLVKRHMSPLCVSSVLSHL